MEIKKYFVGTKPGKFAATHPKTGKITRIKKGRWGKEITNELLSKMSKLTAAKLKLPKP